MSLDLAFDFAQIEWLFVFIGTTIILASLCIVFILKLLKFQKWQVRKLGHMLVHFVLAFFPYMYSYMISLIVTVIIVLVLAGIISLIPQIRFIQRLYRECTREGERIIELVINSISTAFAILLILFVFADKLYIFTAALLTVSLGDGMWEMIGRPYGRIKYKIFSERSLEGSLFVFIGTFLSIVIAYGYHSLLGLEGFWWKIAIVSLVGMVVEACNFRFIDNTTLPLSIALSLFLLFEI